MRLQLDIRPAADEDMVEIADWIGQDNLDAAIEFLHAARRSMEFLTVTPGAGPEYPTSNALLKGLRKWSVEGYRHYLIFYLILPDAIKVLRVIHGSRNVPALLAGETRA